ncbi:hypothetical protein BSLG_006536 [Batrachochytrium salamandrivorans]|nr:hypothetical protein BSLG_006536 [Batrachochytrium salamandrivorans]
MFGQNLKWGFQRTRTKSDTVQYPGNYIKTTQSLSPSTTSSIEDRRGWNPIDELEEKSKSKRLLELCQEGNLVQARQFCLQNAYIISQSINSPMDANNNTPLHLTVAQNDYVMTCFLLQKGADPNVANQSDVTPITIAKRMGYTKMINLLIMYGATPPPKHEKIFQNMPNNDHGSADEDGETEGMSGSGPTNWRISFGSVRQISDKQGCAGTGDLLSQTQTMHPRGMQGTGQLVSNGQLLSNSSYMTLIFNAVNISLIAPLAVYNNTQPSSLSAFNKSIDGTGFEEDIQRRHMFQDSMESKHFTICNAAYLGLKAPLLQAVTQENINYSDEAECTGLMKAAYRGNLDLVKCLVERGANVNSIDRYYNTPLIWSIIMGHISVVKYLIDEAGSDIHGMVPEDQPGDAPLALAHQQRPFITPLIVAAYGGHLDITEYILCKGVDINTRVGPGRGQTALMIAAWMRRKAIVGLLLQNRAHVEPNVDAWLTKGMVHLKKVALEGNAWLGHAGQDSSTSIGGISRRDYTSLSTLALNSIGPSSSLAGTAVAGSISQQRRISLQDKLMYFSPGDSEIAGEISQMLLTHGNTAFKSSHEADSRPDSISISTSSDVSENRTHATHNSRGNIHRRRNNTFRQGLNLDKIIGSNSGMVMTLAEQMPDRGTELDGLWIAVFQCVVQLVMAANKNIKHHYIAISAKAIHCSSEIIRAIEMIDKSSNTCIKPGSFGNGVGSGLISTVGLNGAIGQGVHTQNNSSQPVAQGINSVSSAKPSATISGLHTDLSLFSQTPTRSRMSHLARIISNKFPKQLMLSTRMAIGVWPPPDAVADMIREASSLAASCREIVLLANTLGHYPVLETNFEVSFNAFEDGQDQDGDAKSDALSSPVERDKRPKIPLSYSEYKRQNDLKLIEEMSKRYDLGGRESLQDILTSDEKSMDQEFFKTLDSLLKQFVVSVSEIKNLHDQHLKEEFIKATSTVHARADTLMEEINSFELFKDFPDDVVIDQDDVTRLEASGVKLLITIFPCPIKPFYRLAFDEVKNSARQVMSKGKIAAASWPPPNSAAEMLQATIPCALAVKKLVILAKESASKVRQTHLEERRKRDHWRKECLQNERVKKLFQMWESQLLGDQSSMFKKPSAILTMDELKALEDSTEGLVLEEVNGKRLIKGGRLNKLLEAATGHENNEDFVEYDQFILRYRDFVEKKVKFDFEQLSITMLETLEKKLNEDSSSRPIPQLSPDREKLCPKSILPQRGYTGGHAFTDHFSTLLTDPKAYLEIDPQEMARQLTLVEFELFTRVRPYECLDQIWDGHRRKENLTLKGIYHAKNRESGEKSLSNLSRLIQHTNQISFWIATNVVTQDTPKSRMMIIKYFTQVAMHCREMNNLTGVTTIIGALSMSPISRLHKTWKVLEDKHAKIFEGYKDMADLVSPKFQYANYRRALKEMQPPAIPFLGVYLTDLTFIELGNPDFLPDSHFVNFDKRRKVYTLIKEIQRYAQVPFSLSALQPIQEFLRKLSERKGTPVGWEESPLMTEDELYEQSLLVEPKEPETDSDEE